MIKRLKGIVFLIVLTLCMVFTVSEAKAAKRPDKVKNVNVEKTTTDSIRISYEGIAGALGYDIQIFTAKGELVKEISTKYTEKTVLKLLPATGYQIRVRAYNRTDSGKKRAGLYSDFLRCATTPTKIKSLWTKNPTETSMTLSWSKVENATGYFIFVWDSSIANWKYIKGTNKLEYTATDLEPGKSYEYMIKPFFKYKGINYLGNSRKKIVKGAPGSIEALQIESNRYDEINVSWSVSKNATSYKVQLFVGESIVKDAVLKSTSITFRGLDIKEEYTVKVTPYIWYSSEVMVYGKMSSQIAFTKLSMVSDVKIKDVGKDFLHIEFPKVEYANEYIVYFSKKDEPENIKKTVITGNEYLEAGLESGVEYLVKLQAVRNIDGTEYLSDISKEYVFYTLEEGIKEYMFSKNYGDSIEIGWKEIERITRYVVYYKKAEENEYINAGRVYKPSVALDGLEGGTVYNVQVVPVYEIDGRAYVASFVTGTVQTAPERVKLNGGYTKDGNYVIEWSDAKARTGFDLRKYDESKKEWVKVTGTVNTTYTYKVTDENDTLRFKVRAYTKMPNGEFIFGRFSDDIVINSGRWGIDVSKHQGEIDWKKVAEDGIEFAIIRVGYRGYAYGTIKEDPYFKANIEGALENGIDVGIYFFSTAISKAEAVEEAKWTLDKIKGYNVTYPIVFDYEGYENPDYRSYGQTRKDRSDYAIAFLDYVREKGYLPMMYASQYYYNRQWDTDRLSDYNLWVAKYPSGNNGQLVEGSEPKIEYPYAMWQYSSTGRVEGIQTGSGAYKNVDMNYQYTSFKK